MPLRILLLVITGASAQPSIADASSSKQTAEHFVTTWQTAVAGDSITIPVGGGPGTYTVDWGDGTVSAGVSGDQTHMYAVASTHTVRIYGGFTRISLGSHPDAQRLQSIDQQGSIQLSSMNSAFEGASNMEYRATDIPDLSGVADMSDMFRGSSSFNGDLSNWDVSSATSMHSMFDGADAFDRNLGNWYIVLNSASINDGDESQTVGSIAAQNFLDVQNPVYGIGSGGDSDLFEINGNILKIKERSGYPIFNM